MAMMTSLYVCQYLRQSSSLWSREGVCVYVCMYVSTYECLCVMAMMTSLYANIYGFHCCDLERVYVCMCARAYVHVLARVCVCM